MWTADRRASFVTRTRIEHDQRMLHDAIAEACRELASHPPRPTAIDPSPFEPLVRNFARAVREASLQPERLVVLLKECFTADGLWARHREALDALLGTFLRWAIDEYYRLP